ncbi:MFS transporter, partial [bacterium]|nr:MFS transporter [bacterium]
YVNDGSGNFSEEKVITSQADGAASVYAADLDGDKDIDVLSASAEDDKIAWYVNDGSGNFSEEKVITTNARDIQSVYATDLDSDDDKDMDIITVSAVEGIVAWYENAPLKKDKNKSKPGTFSEKKVIVTRADGGIFSNQRLIMIQADGARTVYSADLDSDGDPDILKAAGAEGTVRWYENDSSLNLTLLLLFNFIWSLIAGAMPVFLFAMFADTADFHEWKFSRRATGLVIAGIMFAIKMGVAAGGFLNLQILNWFGYMANVPQIPASIQGIRLLFSIIPAGFILICGMMLFFYPINEKLLMQIEIDLKQRKESEQE